MKNEQHIIDNIRKAKLKLFTNQLIFFGMNVNKFSWLVEEIPESIEGYVRFNIDDLSQLETGAIHLNERYLSEADYTFDNLAFLLCHELLHILHKHGSRRGERISELWAVACDHVVEVFLKTLSTVFRPYMDNYNIVPDLNSALPNCTTEQAYDWLLKNRKIIHIEVKNDYEIHVTNQNGDLLFIVNMNIGGISADSNDDNRVENIITDQLVAEARAIFETIKDKGHLPGNIVSYLDQILKVDIPWEILLEKAIKTNTIMKPDERCWRNLNKYYIPHNLTLPGYSSIEEQEGVGTLIVWVDSSGSVSDKNLRKFAGVIEASMKYFKKIVVLVHDSYLHQTETFSKDNIMLFYKFLKEVGFKGRGGTSHVPVFDEVQNKYWQEEKDDLSMVISLTDMYSDIGSCYKGYEWVKNNLPLVFIITSEGHTINLDETFGCITQIKINN